MGYGLAPGRRLRQRARFVWSAQRFVAFSVDRARARTPTGAMTGGKLSPRTVSALWALGALACGVVAAQALRPEAEPAPLVAATQSYSAAPEADAGPSLPDACSRRVGCLLR